MNTEGTKELDTILGHVRILQYGIDTLLSDPSSELKLTVGVLTDYFNDLEVDSHHFNCRTIDDELNNWLGEQADLKLINKVGHYLIRIYKAYLRPLKNGLEAALNLCSDQSRLQTLSGPELQLILQNDSFCRLVYQLVKRWTWAIYANLDAFYFDLSNECTSILNDVNVFNEFDSESINTSSRVLEAKFSTYYLKHIIELARLTRNSFIFWQRVNKKGSYKPIIDHFTDDQLLEKEGFVYDLAEDLGSEIENCFFSIPHFDLHKSYARILADTLIDLQWTIEDLDIDKFEKKYPSINRIQINPTDIDSLKLITLTLRKYWVYIHQQLRIFDPGILWRRVERHRFPVSASPTDPNLRTLDSDIKLTWSCKPAVAGYIISELIRAGYLEPTITNRELSYAKLGVVCQHLFSFAEHAPTAESWRKVLNPDSNTLPDNKRIKLHLPDYSELS